MTVNLHPRPSTAHALADDVAAALTASGLPAHRLGLELAESRLAEDPRRITDQLQQLHALGARVFIDDFGAGGSPLGQLFTLPITALKLDPCLLAGEHDPATGDRRDPCGALVVLAAAMGADALAEGIETPQQLAHARAAGCRHGQGHLLAAPMPADRIADWLTEHNVGDQRPSTRGGQYQPQVASRRADPRQQLLAARGLMPTKPVHRAPPHRGKARCNGSHSAASRCPSDIR